MPSSINPKQIVFNYIKLKSLDKNPNTKFTAKFWKVQNCAKCLIMHGAKYINPSGQNIKQLLKMLNTRHSLLTSFSEWFGEWVTILINRRIINFFQFVSLYFNLYLKCSIKWKDKSHRSKCQRYHVQVFMELTNEHFQKKEKHNYIRKMTSLKIFLTYMSTFWACPRCQVMVFAKNILQINVKRLLLNFSEKVLALKIPSWHITLPQN